MIWNWLTRPILFSLPAETAHLLAMKSLAVIERTPPCRSLLTSCLAVKDDRLKVRQFGIDFENPIGLAAGFDKNAEWFDVLPSLGFGHVEVGTITAEAQSGNDRPRLFRLRQDQALLNRMGFNNHGCAVAAKSIERRRKRGVVGINIGKTKVVDIGQAEADYLKSFTALFHCADYFTVNVSSPNTPGLRQLQDRDRLQNLLAVLTAKNIELADQHQTRAVPILLKIAPDLTESQLHDVIEISLRSQLAGIVATNTTISREGLSTSASQLDRLGAGGISGKPLTERSRDFVRRIHQTAQGKLPIIGVGGVMCGDDAWQMICAGAALVQVYTGFVYQGPGFVKSLNKYLLDKVASNGLASISEAVGSAT